MKIICFHQSADLYGSDRSFLQVVEYLAGTGRFEKISVVLPRTGPLVQKLSEVGVEVQFMDLSLLSKTYLKKLQWGKILFPLFSFGRKKRLIQQYDLLYINTSVILDGYVLAPFLKMKKVIHIREIPTGWLSKILSAFISRSGATVIYNSESTRRSFAPFDKQLVIHNAFEGYRREEQPVSTREKDSPLKILLIGRINTWKGQDFAIRALAKCANKNIKLRIVGSTAAGNENQLADLKTLAADLGLLHNVEFVDFIDDPSAEYYNSDVVVVPSIKPEPFGRIAIEAMSAGKPVVAANHGGLPEIVEHGVNGFLFTPGEVDSYNNFITKYIDDPSLIARHGRESERIFREKFSIERMHRALDTVFEQDEIFDMS